MELTVVLGLLKRFAMPLALILTIGVGVHLNNRANYWHESYTQSQASLKAERTAYRTAQATAARQNNLEVAATEAKWKAVATSTKETYSEKLSDANARVASYVERMRSQTVAATRSSTSTGDIPETTTTAKGSDGSGKGPIISGGPELYVPVTAQDLGICAENTVKAISWQIFYGDVLKASNTPPK